MCQNLDDSHIYQGLPCTSSTFLGEGQQLITDDLGGVKKTFLTLKCNYCRPCNAAACSSVIIPLLTPIARTSLTFVLLLRVLSITSSSSFI